MKRSWFIAGAAVLLTAATPAAAVMRVTYNGVVESGSDLTGLFGAANADLAGLSFTATYLFDDTPDGQFFNPPLNSGWDSGYFDPGPQVILTIGGQTRVSDCGFFVADYCSFSHVQSAAPGDWRVESELNAFTVDISSPTGPETWDHLIHLGVSSATNPFVSSFDYRTPLDYLLQPGDLGFGVVSLRNVADIGEPTEHIVYQVDARLTPTSVSVSIPEPATWAVMILGFGLAGAALRRRRGGAAEAAPPASA